MRIEVENLTKTGKPFTHEFGLEELDLGDERVKLTSPAAVSGQASSKEDEVRLRGAIRAEVEVACDRCLAAVKFPVEVEFDTSFLPEEVGRDATENLELRVEDMAASFYDGEAVDVSELVREQVILAVPTRLLCSEQCKGLCPKCGADLNAEGCACEQGEVDPRWAALANLKKQDRES